MKTMIEIYFGGLVGFCVAYFNLPTLYAIPLIILLSIIAAVGLVLHGELK